MIFIEYEIIICIWMQKPMNAIRFAIMLQFDESIVITVCAPHMLCLHEVMQELSC